MIITIDGPSASGKSSVARVLAQRLNIYYLYTGLLYRAIAYLLSRKFGQFGPDFKIGSQDLALIKKISYEYYQGQPQLFYEGENITSYLNESAMDQLSSIISVNKQVREALLTLQREIAKKYDLIADGRDCGSVVFPDAEYKFYLTASLDVRAHRRLLDLQKKGGVATFKQVRDDLEERDHRDTNRDVAPLKIPENAIVIDSSAMTLDETVEAILQHLGSKLSKSTTFTLFHKSGAKN